MYNTHDNKAYDSKAELMFKIKSMIFSAILMIDHLIDTESAASLISALTEEIKSKGTHNMIYDATVIHFNL